MSETNSISRVTIYDLAKELNVSASTVSRALNDRQEVSKKTRTAVQKLAKERGYQPNNIALSLRTNKSNTIGIMVSWINRPFISNLISGIEKRAKEAGYHVIITQTHDKQDNEIENIQALMGSRISAMIVSLAMETKDFDHFTTLRDHNIPVVFVDRIPPASDAVRIQIDNYKAAFTATEHLIQQGCKRIAHFGGSKYQLIYKERRAGYLAALSQYGFEVDESLVLEATNLSMEEGLRMTEKVLNMDNPPDGIFCANDSAGVSAIRYAKKKGIKIPEELAIMGFNNDPVCEIIEPELSSVVHPAIEMGERAVEEVLSLLKSSSENRTSLSVILSTEVVVRDSTNRLKEKP